MLPPCCRHLELVWQHRGLPAGELYAGTAAVAAAVAAAAVVAVVAVVVVAVVVVQVTHTAQEHQPY